MEEKNNGTMMGRLGGWVKDKVFFEMSKTCSICWLRGQNQGNLTFEGAGDQERVNGAMCLGRAERVDQGYMEREIGYFFIKREIKGEKNRTEI